MGLPISHHSDQVSTAQVFDLAIAGGGLAGLSLAIQAANKGYSTLLFEKEHYPFHKVCGEYISFESWDFLKSLGVPLDAWKLPVINTLEASDIRGSRYRFFLPLGGFGVSRHKLDHELYQLALQKGVQVFTNTKVNDIVFNGKNLEAQSSAGTYLCRVAAGSFGKKSNLDVKWNRGFVQQKAGKLNNYIGVKYHIEYSSPDDTIGLHNFHNGYCGISNIEEGRSCLCYLTTAANLKKSGNSISRMEQEILQQNPILKTIFSQARFVWPEPQVISQISFELKSQVENHVLMIGDSAGMIAPLCGNGMSMAMHASKIAFDCIDVYLQNKLERSAMEERYSKLWKEQFSKRLWIGRTVQRFFGNNRMTSLFFKTMQGIPAFAKQVIRSSHGEPF